MNQSNLHWNHGGILDDTIWNGGRFFAQLFLSFIRSRRLFVCLSTTCVLMLVMMMMMITHILYSFTSHPIVEERCAGSRPNRIFRRAVGSADRVSCFCVFFCLRFSIHQIITLCFRFPPQSVDPSVSVGRLLRSANLSINLSAPSSNTTERRECLAGLADDGKGTSLRNKKKTRRKGHFCVFLFQGGGQCEMLLYDGRQFADASFLGAPASSSICAMLRSRKKGWVCSPGIFGFPWTTSKNSLCPSNVWAKLTLLRV